MAKLGGDADSSDTSASKNAKLPKIELQRFSGQITEFQALWDQYHATIQFIHSSDLPTVKKIHIFEGVVRERSQGNNRGVVSNRVTLRYCVPNSS